MAIVTPSLHTIGAPKDFWIRTDFDFGPSVMRTASAKSVAPCRTFSRAAARKRTCLCAICHCPLTGSQFTISGWPLDALTVLKLRRRGSGSVLGNDLDFVEDIIDAEYAPGIPFGGLTFRICCHRARQSHPSVADPNADLACVDKRVLLKVGHNMSFAARPRCCWRGLLMAPGRRMRRSSKP